MRQQHAQHHQPAADVEAPCAGGPVRERLRGGAAGCPGSTRPGDLGKAPPFQRRADRGLRIAVALHLQRDLHRGEGIPADLVKAQVRLGGNVAQDAAPAGMQRLFVTGERRIRRRRLPGRSTSRSAALTVEIGQRVAADLVGARSRQFPNVQVPQRSRRGNAVALQCNRCGRLDQRGQVAQSTLNRQKDRIAAHLVRHRRNREMPLGLRHERCDFALQRLGAELYPGNVDLIVEPPEEIEMPVADFAAVAGGQPAVGVRQGHWIAVGHQPPHGDMRAADADGALRRNPQADIALRRAH